MNERRTSGHRENPRVGISPEASPSASPDITVSYHGSLALFHPMTEAACGWMAEHCPADGNHIYFIAALAVEPRYVESLLRLAREDGLLV